MNLKLPLALLASLTAQSAWATQTSFFCKSLTTTDVIDVVSKGERTNDVLVQIDGGKFFDGNTVLLGKILIVTVSFDNGGLILSYNTSGPSSLIIANDGKQTTLDLKCQFR